jgi:hypothetical protein
MSGRVERPGINVASPPWVIDTTLSPDARGKICECVSFAHAEQIALVSIGAKLHESQRRPADHLRPHAQGATEERLLLSLR